MTTLNDTPTANRIHIGFFGKRNSGKSSLLNAFTGQKVAIVSKELGTTTDPVYKAMELHELGACMLMDTPGFDDEGTLGALRIEKTKEASNRTNLALLLFHDKDITQELEWFAHFKEKKMKTICILSKCDLKKDVELLAENVRIHTGQTPIEVSVHEKESIKKLKEEIIKQLGGTCEIQSITDFLVTKEDVVLLVMPQDIQAPKGRLILPQVQTIRDLLDHRCIVVCTTTEELDQALHILKQPPKLIITDSQVFKEVYDKKPKESMLTSFSVLFSRLKGDLSYYIKGAKTIDTLTKDSKVLIAECCTHAPLSEDIGREKIPNLLRKKVGGDLQVSVVSGTDFPLDLTGYDLIIQCGACMFQRQYVMSRIERAKQQHVPMTNYGITIAHLKGILDKIEY